MKKYTHIIVFFWALFVMMPLYSQRDLKVKAFFEDEKDISARTRGEVKDYNGKDCALIIIKMPTIEDATIKPAMKTVYENGQYLIYVPTSTKTITILCKDYNNLSYSIAESLKPKTTYKMVIDVPMKIIILEKDKQSKWSIDASIIAGQAVGAEIDFTVSYFLIGIGADWFVGKTKGLMQKKTLYNSGYTGNFLREKTVSLSGTRTQLFANIGAYFRYVSVGCQVGVLFCQNSLTELSYSGNGIGIQDEYIDQNWGEYAHYTIDKSIESKNMKYLTVSPVIKGYIPINGTYGLTIGAGYTFIPAVSAGAAWGSVGLQVKFD